MKKNQNKVRALAKKAYARAAANENVCIDGVTELLDIIETGLTDDALTLFTSWVQMATNERVVSWSEIRSVFSKEDLARHNVFLEGEHEVKDGEVICGGTAIIRASGRCHIYAFEDSHVFTEDACFIWAHDRSTADVRGGIVHAFHNSSVSVRLGVIYAFDEAKARGCSRSLVHTTKHLKISPA